jgi:hypothetical protein
MVLKVRYFYLLNDLINFTKIRFRFSFLNTIFFIFFKKGINKRKK